MEEQEKKNVDESYKDQVEKEKQTGTDKKEFVVPEASFTFFLSTIGMQAAIAMGDIPDPVDNKREDSLPQARFLIDTLGVLKEKTKNNLTKEENDLLESMLYELRMRYVQKTGNKQSEG